jgi:hypothetical protein
LTNPLRQHRLPRKQPPAPTSTDQVRARINDTIRKQLPALPAVYNGALQEEADKQAMKKQPKGDPIRRKRDEIHYRAILIENFFPGTAHCH